MYNRFRESRDRQWQAPLDRVVKSDRSNFDWSAVRIENVLVQSTVNRYQTRIARKLIPRECLVIEADSNHDAPY